MADIAPEKFDIKKFFLSLIPASGEQWGKWLSLAWKLGVFLVIGLVVYNCFFKKQVANVNQPDSTQRVLVLPGAKVEKVYQTSVQKNEQKAEIKKRAWWMPIPFVQTTYGISNIGSDNKQEFRAEGGLRIDLN